MKIMMNTKIALPCILLVAVGCATPPPPQQLLDARREYDKARNGPAARLTPADLHTAKVKLNEAEQSYTEEPDSANTYAVSYVALRQAQMVQVLANTRAAQAELKAAEEELVRLRDADMARTRGDLARAKRQLAQQGQKLAVSDAQLASTAAQLEAERQARLAAEEREREAMRRLAEAAAVKVEKQKRGTVIILPGNVLFASGKYELTSAAQRKLTLVAGTIAPQAENHNMIVEGHTDSKGRRDSNMTLSEHRARVVMEFLVARGVPGEAITSTGLGPDRPIADNSSRDGRAQNRRVEIVIKPMEHR